MKSGCKVLAVFLITAGVILSPHDSVGQDNKMKKNDANIAKGDMKNKMGDSKMKSEKMSSSNNKTKDEPH